MAQRRVLVLLVALTRALLLVSVQAWTLFEPPNSALEKLWREDLDDFGKKCVLGLLKLLLLIVIALV